MSPLARSPLALLLLFFLPLGRPAPRDGETLHEDLADGGRVEREVERDAGGRPVSNGAYRRWFASGTLAAEGGYLHGAREGEWVTYHESGAVASRGKYVGGEQVGKWRTLRSDGSLESEGAYRRGLRFGKWTFLDERGVRTGDSGEYEARFLEYPDGAPLAKGSLRVGKRHGRWVWLLHDGTLACEGEYRNGRRDGTWSWFADGRPRLRGDYRRDERVGDWIFRHPDGIPDPLFLSGRFEDGERIGPPAAVPEPPRPLAELLAGLPEPEPAPSLADADRARVAGLVQKVVDGSVPEREEALAALAGDGIAALPATLHALLALDLSDHEGALTAYRLDFGLLAQVTGGHLFEWTSGFGAEAVAANRMVLRRWLTLWDLTRGDPAFWDAVRAAPASEKGEALFARLLEPRLLQPLAGVEDEGAAEELAAPPGGAPPAAEEAPEDDAAAARAELLRRYGGEGTTQALEDALGWLAAHQDEDGKWDALGFQSHCPPDDAAGCAGGGFVTHDVGTTGLALLAFLGAGSSLRDGPYQDPVRRAVHWLQTGQNPVSGLMADPDTVGFAYDHAIATHALCEAARGANDPALERCVQKAVDLILRMQNPGAGWRYDLPPRGESDTSVTVWMVTALAAARDGGYRVDPAAFEGARAWLDAATDPRTGRIGYDSRGSWSARAKANEKYPRELGEAMSAAGLWARYRIGDPPPGGALGPTVQLVLQKPPDYRPGWEGNDLYYWYYGTYALFQVGEPAWDVWNRAMRATLLAWQAREGHAKGSFAPDDAWGFAGGRVATTALAALALEVYFRYPRFAER